jgi:glycosyltransferase involved in cell wall biosynthesis
MIEEGCCPNKITVITNAMSFEGRFWTTTKKKLDQSPRLLAIGRIDWEKNYFALLNMIAILKNDHPRVKLTILGAGDDALLAQLKQYCLHLNILENVEWAGWNASTFERFSESDILVHAALDEACPLVLIEGLILGIPIVSTQQGGSSDVLKNYYVPCNTADPIEFSNRISSLLLDWEKTVSYAASIRDAAKEEFNLYTLGRRYEDVVSNLINGAYNEN